MIEKMVIVNWYEPDEKLPEEGVFTIVTFSGKAGSIRYEKTFGIAEWFNDGLGWTIHDIPEDAQDIVVHAWCDLEPYGGDK